MAIYTHGNIRHCPSEERYMAIQCQQNRLLRDIAVKPSTAIMASGQRRQQARKLMRVRNCLDVLRVGKEQCIPGAA